MLNKKLKMSLLFFINCFLMISLGCSDSSNKNEIKNFIKSTKARKMQEVEALPEKKQKIDIKYLGFDKRSPFISSDTYIRSRVATSDSILEPDLTRSKEVLEQYSLDDLKMVGSLKKADGGSWALITDNQGVVHKITVGNYIGDNFGQVIKVDEKSIEIKEAITNGYGGWQENTVIMKLKE